MAHRNVGGLATFLSPGTGNAHRTGSCPTNRIPWASGVVMANLPGVEDNPANIKEMSAMPIFSPDFCENRCPVCTRARKGHRLARLLQKIEMLLTFGGCPWGRARQRKYGVRPDEALPGPGTRRD